VLILVTNDDGIHAPGLAALVDAARTIGEVFVIAPMVEQSGVAHSITLSRPLRVTEVERNDGLFGYGVDGAPADCVKLAVRRLLGRKPDLLLSGVNLGANLGINVFYSGTVAAAREGAILGIASVAVSVQASEQPEFTTAARIAARVARGTLGLAGEGRPSVLLNVNVPAVPHPRIQGIRATHQSLGGFREGYDARRDRLGRRCYWLTSGAQPEHVDPGSDVEAVEDGFVSVTPLRHDLTQLESLDAVRESLDALARET